MTLRVWALKIGELRPLSRGGLLLLTVRCAMRVEPWLPPGLDALWLDGFEHVASTAFEMPARSNPATTLARALSNRGAEACNRLAPTDEPLGRCMNYATQTLAAAVRAAGLEAGPVLKKAVIDSAKLSASVAGVLAHAGRVRVATGNDPVAVACVAMWDAIRADIPVLAAVTSELGTAANRVQALRELAPLWPGRAPAWVRR
jgi:hypothetical protein